MELCTYVCVYMHVYFKKCPTFNRICQRTDENLHITCFLVQLKVVVAIPVFYEPLK